MNFKNHVKSDKVKWIFTTIVIVLIFAVLIGLCYSAFTGIAPQDWGKEDNSGTVEDVPVTDGDGNELTAEVNPMPDVMVFSQSAMYNGTSTGYSATVEATVGSLYSEPNGIKWSVRWEDENSEWASDKNINDYVTVYSRVGSDEVCNTVCMITCSQAFGETVILEASLVNHPYIPSATCEVEFRQRVIGYDVVFYDGTFGGYYIDEELPEGVSALVPLKTTNANGNDKFLFNYGGTTGFDVSIGDRSSSAPAINARIVPIFDTYTIEDASIKTTSVGVPTDSFLNTVGIICEPEYISCIDHVSFTNWLYTFYTLKTNEETGESIRIDRLSNVFAYIYTHAQVWTVTSEYAYLSGVYACLQNNEGVWRYTVESTSDYTGTYTYTFDLGYTESSYQNAWGNVIVPEVLSLNSTLVI